MKIDVHSHFTSRSYYDALESLPGVTVERRTKGVHFLLRNGSPWLPFGDHMFDPDHLIRDMDRKQIDHRVLSLSTPSVYDFEQQQRIEVCREQNDAIIARVAKDPDRLSAVITLPLPDIEASLIEFERVYQAPGIVGLALGSNLNGTTLSDPLLEPIWKKLDETRFPVIEHPMVPVFSDIMDEFALTVRVGFMYDTSLALARMIYAGVFERYQNFPFVVAHTGAAFCSLLERLDNGYRNYADCSQHISRLPSEFAKDFWYDSCSFFAPYIEMVTNIVGVEKMMFGTDYPFIDRDSTHVEQLSFDQKDKIKILGENARNLFAIQ